MDVVSHDNIRMKLKAALFTIVAENVNEKHRHALGLEDPAPVDDIGSDKERPGLLGG